MDTHFCSAKDLIVVMACSEWDVSTSEREKRDGKGSDSGGQGQFLEHGRGRGGGSSLWASLIEFFKVDDDGSVKSGVAWS